MGSQDSAMRPATSLGVLTNVFLIPRLVWGHGMLTDPPARNAMWRYGYTNPVNYNDNELYCGGFSVQWDRNDGNCGVCGDSFSDRQPRAHESGGKYGNGTLPTALRTVNVTLQSPPQMTSLSLMVILSLMVMLSLIVDEGLESRNYCLIFEHVILAFLNKKEYLIRR